MKDVELIQVIRTEHLTRGAGTPEDPVRRITQIWLPDGTLVAESDPCARSIDRAGFQRILQSIAKDDPVGDLSPRQIEIALFGLVDPMRSYRDSR